MFIFAEIGQENLVSVLLDFKSNLINWILLIVLLVWAIKKFVPAFISQRQQAINDELQLAIKTRQDAEVALAEQKSKIDKAEHEAEKIVLEAKETAKRMSDDLKKQTEAEIADLHKKFDAALTNEKQSAISEMRSVVARAAVQLAEESLKSGLNEKSKTKIAHEFMGELSKIGSSNLENDSVKNRNDQDQQKVARA